MRNEEFDKTLKKPYEHLTKDTLDSRFNSAVGADIPSAKKLVQEKFLTILIKTFRN